MKVLKRILLGLVVIVFIFIGIRTVNGIRYKDDQSVTEQKLNEKDYYTQFLKNDNGEIVPFEDKGANGFHFKPTIKLHKGTIITLGGSEGGCMFDRALDLYNQGYEVIALFFFGQANQPETLSDVPLEFFADVEQFMQKNSVDMSEVTLIGASKGAELALLLTQYYDSITNLVLYAPSAYIFQGLDMTNQSSSWSYENKPLSYLSFQNADGAAMGSMMGSMIFNYPMSFYNTYNSLSATQDAQSDAWIYKNKIKGNILVFAGDSDEMWPSATYGKELQTYDENIELHVFNETGHLFSELTYANGMAFGGTKENNVQAKIESDKILNEFLLTNHE